VPILASSQEAYGSLDLISFTQVLDTITKEAIHENSILGFSVWVWGYILVSSLFLFQFLTGLWKIISLYRKSRIQIMKNTPVRVIDGLSESFTFFRTIFMGCHSNNDTQSHEIILCHETVHARELHTLDIFSLQLFRVLFWWMPSTWITISELKKIHEYQADSKAIKTMNSDSYTHVLIANALKSSGLGLVHAFHDGSIADRLRKLKQVPRRINNNKSLLLTGIVIMVAVIFACEPSNESVNMDLNKEENTPASKSGWSSENEVFSVVDQTPVYPGGMKAFYSELAGKIKYPKDARLEGIEGRVLIQFIVEKDGSLTSFETLKSPYDRLSAAAMAALRQFDKFEPGTVNGKKVRVRLVLPVSFEVS